MSIKIDFFPNASKQPRRQPIAAKLVITNAQRQAMLKFGFITKEIVGDEAIDVVCHDPKVAEALAASLRKTASDLDAAIARAGGK